MTHDSNAIYAPNSHLISQQKMDMYLCLLSSVGPEIARAPARAKAIGTAIVELVDTLVNPAKLGSDDDASDISYPVISMTSASGLTPPQG